MELKEAAVAYEVEEAPMIRTQIYLNKTSMILFSVKRRALTSRWRRLIRNFIDEKMDLPMKHGEHPMFKPWPADPHNDSPEDAAINHDITFMAVRRSGLR